MDQLMINSMFTYHKPVGTQPDRYVAIREKTKELATFYNENSPSSPEQTLAIRHLQLAVMLINASIAIHEPQN